MQLIEKADEWRVQDDTGMHTFKTKAEAEEYMKAKGHKEEKKEEPKEDEQMAARRRRRSTKRKSIPTNKALYARVKSAAKRKFAVYPSAYANAWLVREYKKRGGKYRSGQYYEKTSL